MRRRISLDDATGTDFCRACIPAGRSPGDRRNIPCLYVAGLTLFARGPSYGYDIIQQIREVTDGDVEWTMGTLYPVLHDMENKGLLESFWREAESGPKRKYYRLTEKGRSELVAEKQAWMGIHRSLTDLWETGPGLSLGEV